MSNQTVYSPTRQKIMDLLADGQRHTREELRNCLFDELGVATNIHAHLTGLRQQLRPFGEDISCTSVSGQRYYQKVKTTILTR